jgi:CRP-like cAMP-binding protein
VTIPLSSVPQAEGAGTAALSLAALKQPYDIISEFVEPPATSPLTKKLKCFRQLSAEEIIAINVLPCRSKQMGVEQVFIHEGTIANHLFLILEGFAYRYKLLADGRRQIMAFLLPGDLCNFRFAQGEPADHSVAALSNASVGIISIAAFASLRTEYPKINDACSLALLSERTILRQWVMNVGQRNALQRISHLFCEISARMNAIGRGNEGGLIDFPLTQAALADTIGLTTVHVNRSLRLLRDRGLIAYRRQRVTIVDASGLASQAGFDHDYLRFACYPDCGAQARNGSYGTSGARSTL